MESTVLSEVASRSVIGTFYSQLVKLDKHDLNHLLMGEYPKWARRVIDAERRRRKEQGHDGSPTKAEKGLILTIGEGGTPSQAVPDQQGLQTPTPATTKARKRQQQKLVRLEIDGGFLHEHVSNEAPFHVAYDQDLDLKGKRRLLERSVGTFGSFVCMTPTCRKNKWTSGIVATLIEFSSHSNSYRTTLFAQKCRKCEEYAEPTVDESAYAEGVVWVLSLWKGYRERENSEKRSPKGLHDEERCYACRLDKCPWKTREE